MMTFENLPPLSDEMLDIFRNQAAAMQSPGGAVAFHIHGVLVYAAVAIAGDVCHVLSWMSQGPLTREEVEAQYMQRQIPAKPIPIN